LTPRAKSLLGERWHYGDGIVRFMMLSVRYIVMVATGSSEIKIENRDYAVDRRYACGACD
jgi:hypothetical protein